MTAAEPDAARSTPAHGRAQRERVKISQDIAASLANELRNPVFAIASAAQLLRYRVTDDPVVEKNIGRILREVERLNALVSALVDYGRPAPIRLAPGDPDEIWSAVLEAQRGVLESKAIVVQHAPADPRAECNVDPEQFGEACASALVAAASLALEGSDIEITSTLAADRSWRSQLHVGGAPVDAEVVHRAFEPLGTVGPGQPPVNLAAADRVLTEHGGSISLVCSADAGIIITLDLPAAHG
jgi:signal transduction histidine kinase